MEDDSGRQIFDLGWKLGGTYDVKLSGGNGLTGGAKGLDELWAAFAGELGTDEENSVGGVVLVRDGGGDFGEVNRSAYVEDLVGGAVVVTNEGLAEVLAEGEDGGHLLGCLLFVAEGLVDAFARDAFDPEAAVEQLGEIAVVVGDAFVVWEGLRKREHVT